MPTFEIKDTRVTRHTREITVAIVTDDAPPRKVTRTFSWGLDVPEADAHRETLLLVEDEFRD